MQRQEQYLEMNFFKRFWYSITKFEKYPEMAETGTKKAIKYFTILMIIFTIIVTTGYVFYISKIAEYPEDVVTLSDKVIYQIDQLYKDMQIGENIQILSEYSDISIIFTIALSVFISFFIITMIDVFTLSIFGLLTCFIAKIKMQYKYIYNMSIYALTLSITLRAIYIVFNLIFSFNIKYFDLMYTAIAYICLAAAIFMIKSDVIKQQIELMKIIQEGKEKLEQVLPKKTKEDEEEKEEKEEKENQEEKQDTGTESQGSNA